VADIPAVFAGTGLCVGGFPRNERAIAFAEMANAAVPVLFHAAFVHLCRAIPRRISVPVSGGTGGMRSAVFYLAECAQPDAILRGGKKSQVRH
ncbi:MAG: hypothetical protein KA165_05005, partial [Saprospiraceae bacterium]|nr:hypothetical protein [Saprospiraceae bacterium]